MDISLLVIHHLMDTHLGECKLRALTFFSLQTADGIEHHLEVFLLLIELRQHAEHIRIAVILGIDINSLYFQVFFISSHI